MSRIVCRQAGWREQVEAGFARVYEGGAPGSETKAGAGWWICGTFLLRAGVVGDASVPFARLPCGIVPLR